MWGLGGVGRLAIAHDRYRPMDRVSLQFVVVQEPSSFSRLTICCRGLRSARFCCRLRKSCWITMQGTVNCWSNAFQFQRLTFMLVIATARLTKNYLSWDHTLVRWFGALNLENFRISLSNCSQRPILDNPYYIYRKTTPISILRVPSENGLQRSSQPRYVPKSPSDEWGVILPSPLLV